MLIVGLTGGIGSGKSTVARLLADRGAVIVDVDAVGRAVIAQGGRAEAGVLAEFGSAIVAADGSIDRPSLGHVVFEHPEQLARLNAISHPAINAELTDRIGSLADDSIVVYDMAILVESNLGREHPTHRYTRGVVVEAPLKLRIERAVGRGMDEADARSRAAAQATDFASFSDWGRWEDSFPTDEKFQSLFAEVVDPKGPIVTPFERTVLTSVP
jgi:dephospho-CoA kinase